MGNPLWAPWRMEYILAPRSRDNPCVFCGVAGAPDEERRERLVLASTPDAFVILNRYPFAAGHLLVVPHAHAGALEDLEPGTHDALFRLVRETAIRLRRAVNAEGLNIGVNQAKRVARYADRRDQLQVLETLGAGLPRQHGHHQQLVRSRHRYYHEAHEEFIRGQSSAT